MEMKTWSDLTSNEQQVLLQAVVYRCVYAYEGERYLYVDFCKLEHARSLEQYGFLYHVGEQNRLKLYVLTEIGWNCIPFATLQQYVWALLDQQKQIITGLTQERDDLRDVVEQLRQSLAWYGDSQNYRFPIIHYNQSWPSAVAQDSGQKARETLEGIKQS